MRLGAEHGARSEATRHVPPGVSLRRHSISALRLHGSVHTFLHLWGLGEFWQPGLMKKLPQEPIGPPDGVGVWGSGAAPPCSGLVPPA